MKQPRPGSETAFILLELAPTIARLRRSPAAQVDLARFVIERVNDVSPIELMARLNHVLNFGAAPSAFMFTLLHAFEARATSGLRNGAKPIGERNFVMAAVGDLVQQQAEDPGLQLGLLTHLQHRVPAVSPASFLARLRNTVDSGRPPSAFVIAVLLSFKPPGMKPTPRGPGRRRG
jgi:hypothetical protein